MIPLLVALILLAFGVPVALCLGLAGTLALWLGGVNLLVVPQQFFSNLASYNLLAIPFFMLTGAVMEHAGMSRRLIDFAQALVGWMRGAMGHVTIVASMFFADISGSATADTAAIGSIMIPGMRSKGYSAAFATALQSAAGSLGLLFPPAMCMIVYAYTANVSVAHMFMASLVPGLLVVVSFMVVNHAVAVRRGYLAVESFSAMHLARTFIRAIWSLGATLVVLGGILFGVFTPVEAGVVAAIYVTLVGTLVHRELRLSHLPRVLAATSVNTARVAFLLGVAFIVGRYLTEMEVPHKAAALFSEWTRSRLIFLLLVNLFFIVMHTALETISSIVVIVPVFMPLALQLGVDPVAFGVVLLINSAIGINLPPVGFCLYTACSISGVRLEQATRAILPFIGVLLIDLALVSIFPEIALMLPNQMR
ncbi:C4-dicarboxylate transporter DctM subunit [Bradyrhizobium sp. USDA 4449]